jgi:hypothetical protein
MSETDIQTLDTLDTSDYMDGQLSDEGAFTITLHVRKKIHILCIQNLKFHRTWFLLIPMTLTVSRMVEK